MSDQQGAPAQQPPAAQGEQGAQAEQAGGRLQQLISIAQVRYQHDVSADDLQYSLTSLLINYQRILIFWVISQLSKYRVAI